VLTTVKGRKAFRTFNKVNPNVLAVSIFEGKTKIRFSQIAN